MREIEVIERRNDWIARFKFLPDVWEAGVDPSDAVNKLRQREAGMPSVDIQTFFIGGQPHQIVAGKNEYKYSVCVLRYRTETQDIVRVRLHVGDLKSCLEFAIKLIEDCNNA